MESATNSSAELTEMETKDDNLTALQSAHLDKCHSFKFKLGFFRVELNPVVTILSAIVIWGLVAFCCISPDLAFTHLLPVMDWITKTWTWLYVGTQDVWALLIIALYFSKYSNMKLGKDDEEPEFNDIEYFTMLFAAGIGIGLFYFGVAEPVYHYAPGKPYGNRFWGRYSDNQRAQDAINLTYFHWGIHGWIVYVIVGMLLAFICYRQGLPMSVRTCFHPILGDRIYGWIGDIIDTLSVVCTMFGVCTSLGIGAMQLNTGLHRMNTDIPISITTQIIIIVIITLIATASVVSGLNVGIKLLSEICFALGNFLMLTWLFYGDTWYFLNTLVQSVGYYFQNIIGIGFHTDAFAQKAIALDKKEEPNWFNDWTMFYWGWWIAWAPFVGMFIAKISRGRTIKQFIMHTLTVPIAYVFVWFALFGAAGIEMERNAEMANVTCGSPFGGKTSTEPFLLNGSTPLYRLSCRNSTDMWFDLMESFPQLYPFLAVVSLIAIILYFVTSSDSGSLVIDTLSANGHPDPPRPQRIFWAFTEGACAIGLLVAGGNKALEALRVVAIAAGLPYTIVLNFMCISLWRVIQMEAGDMDIYGTQFSHDLFTILSSSKQFIKFLVAIVAPWISFGKVDGKLNNSRAIVTKVMLAILFYGAIILVILESAHRGLAYIGATLYFGFAAAGARERVQVREIYGINGNMAEDFFAVLIMYPFVATQLDDHVDRVDLVKKNDDLAMESMDPPKYSKFADGTANPGFQASDNDLNAGIEVTEDRVNGDDKRPLPDDSIEVENERL